MKNRPPNSNDAATKSRFRRARIQGRQSSVWSRLRRWIAGTLLVLLLTLVGGYYYFTRPAWLIRFAEQYLASLVNGDVEIDHAEDRRPWMRARRNRLFVAASFESGGRFFMSDSRFACCFGSGPAG